MEVKIAYDHIEQTRYLLSQIFESGFDSGRNASTGLGDCQQRATELGMAGGAGLLSSLSSNLTAFAAGQCFADNITLAYCNAVSYYNRVADLLTLETISTIK